MNSNAHHLKSIVVDLISQIKWMSQFILEDRVEVTGKDALNASK